jgi:hypothetical protein
MQNASKLSHTLQRDAFVCKGTKEPPLTLHRPMRQATIYASENEHWTRVRKATPQTHKEKLAHVGSTVTTPPERDSCWNEPMVNVNTPVSVAEDTMYLSYGQKLALFSQQTDHSHLISSNKLLVSANVSWCRYKPHKRGSVYVRFPSNSYRGIISGGSLTPMPSLPLRNRRF